MSTLRVVLLGVLGHGKTALFNRITSANEPEIQGGESVTKQIVIGQSTHGEFEIVDTPGFESNSNKLLHAAGVIAALSLGNVHRILIVNKFDNRIDTMISYIKKIIGPIRRYKDLITIVVSHWDYSLNKEQNKKCIQEKISSSLGIKSIFFYSIHDNPQIITKEITNIIIQSKFTQIQLTESEIYTQFDLVSLNDDTESKFDEYKVKLQLEFRNITKIYISYITKQNHDDPDLTDKLHTISLDIKKKADYFVQLFENKYGDYMNELYDTEGINIRYLHHIYLKKEIRLDLEKVIMEAQKKMKESQNHCFNWIKQCPFCGLVWIKVVGCENETTCGNRVNSDYDDLWEWKKQKKYIVDLNNESLELKLNEESNQQIEINFEESYWKNLKILFDSVKDDQVFQSYFLEDVDLNKFQLLMFQIFNSNDFYQGISLIESHNIKKQNGLYSYVDYQNQKSLGCGRIIVWKDLPPLSGPLLKELLSTELMDYFNDYEQILKDEAADIAKELEQTYKELFNQVILEQKKKLKTIPKQKQQKNTQLLNETQNVLDNYKELISKTRENQFQIKSRRQSFRTITEQDTELNDSSLIELLNSSRTEYQNK